MEDEIKQYKKNIKFSFIKLGADSKLNDSIFRGLMADGIKEYKEKKYMVTHYEPVVGESGTVYNFRVGRIANLRDNDIPKIYNNQKVEKEIDLNTDEYLGEDAHFLFDLDKNILFLQRSRYSIKLEELSNLMTLYNKEIINKDTSGNEEKYFIEATPIPTRSGIELLGQEAVKMVEFSILDLDRVSIDTANSPLKDIVKAGTDIGAKSMNVCFSVGRGKYTDINKSKIKKLIDSRLKLIKTDVSNNEEFIKGKVKAQRQGAEILDLFDNVKHVVIPFVFESRTYIPFSQVKEKLYEKYLTARGE